MLNFSLSFKKDLNSWLEQWHLQNGCYLTNMSGLIPGTDRLTWATVDKAFKEERYGLPKGTLAGFKKNKLQILANG